MFEYTNVKHGLTFIDEQQKKHTVRIEKKEPGYLNTNYYVEFTGCENNDTRQYIWGKWSMQHQINQLYEGVVSGKYTLVDQLLYPIRYAIK